MGISSRRLTIAVQIAIVNHEITARQPDFVLLSQECSDPLEGANSAIITPNIPVPALVIEVVSPEKPGEDNYKRDYVEKRFEYAARGIPEYWLIDPSRFVVVVLTPRA